MISKPLKVISKDQAEAIAQKATQKLLGEYQWVSADQDERLVLTSFKQDDAFCFELIVPGERPEDAIVLTHTTVNDQTGDVAVQIFLSRKSEVWVNKEV